MLYRKWNVKEFSPAEVNDLCRQLNINSLLAKVLLARDVRTKERATTKYLDSAPLSDPFLMKDMDKAVRRIWQAIENDEKIVIYGDYDVDGVCATATLFSYLESVGANVFYKLPNRESEGYGLNSAVLAKFKEKGVGLVITVDNGISAIEEVAFANSIGLDIVITDHHLPKREIPAALAVVDPLQKDDSSPCKILAGVGVAFKLVCALEGVACEEMLDYYADFVCTGTVADLMLLEGENRTLVKAGLEILNNAPRNGFESLIKISGLQGKEVTSENIAYTIAPRINAAGRMSDATSALELLLSEDEEDADNLAAFLDSENRKRQETQNKMAEDITNELQDNADMLKDRVIVVWGDEYHPGVVGIVASRLVEKYSRPAIVFTKDGEEYKGSGRSVPAFSLHNALENTKEYLIRFGGHELAAGLAVEKENLEPFRRAINEFANGNEKMSKTADLDIDCLVSLGEISVQSVSQVDFVSPFGNGNPSPLFMARNVQITAVFPVSDGKHVRIKMRQGNNISQGIMFNVSPAEFAYRPGDYIDACFSLSIFQSENGDMVSMRIKEVRPVGMNEKMIDDYDIYRLFINDFSLSEDKKSILRPVRDDVVLIYRKIMADKVNCDDLRPLFTAFNNMSSGKIQIIIDVLTDLGLIEPVRTDNINYYAPVAVKEKKDLMSSKILLSLQ